METLKNKLKHIDEEHMPFVTIVLLMALPFVFQLPCLKWVNNYLQCSQNQITKLYVCKIGSEK